ncbi:MAG: hypothetical protein JXB49_14000 [Bacteroidales bacterium]|nr:hypothetical protein [Bacteroidales bacterium]
MRINTIDELHGLLNGRFPKTKLTFNHRLVGEKDEEKLNACVSECGCDTGKYFLVVGVLFSVLVFIFSDFSMISKILLSVLICFLFAGIGKLIGLIYARYIFYKILRRLLLELGYLKNLPFTALP